jgi:hypothetical protein
MSVVRRGAEKDSMLEPGGYRSVGLEGPA